MPGLVEIDQVSKRFGAQRAVDGLSLTIAPGEIVGFVGPNGAGKSTTLRILAGLVAPDSGSVRLDGVDQRADPSGFRARLGVLIEAPAMFPMLSAYEHLAFVARMRRAFDARRTVETLREVGLDPDSRKTVGTFSLGMKQRLGIAMAIFGAPSLLVLDEPMNGLDPSGIADLRRFLQAVPSRQGASILMSSHLLGEIEQVCHRVVFIRQGRVIGHASLGNSHGSALHTMWLRTGRDAAAAALLRDAPFVAEAVNDEVGVTCRLATDDVPRIAPLLVGAGIEILEITSRGRRLEETYLTRYAADGGAILQ